MYVHVANKYIISIYEYVANKYIILEYVYAAKNTKYHYVILIT